MKDNRKIVLLLVLVMLSTNLVFAKTTEVQKFKDVPAGHYAEQDILQLRELGITVGKENNIFGLGEKITRGQFITFLVRLMDWELSTTQKGSFDDNQDVKNWYFAPVETGVEHGVIPKDTNNFRPNDNITREEMAIMVVRTLGYDELAKKFNLRKSPFSDVSNNIGYITLAKDFDIIRGVDANHFEPNNDANREHAAAMMMRMYNRYRTSIEELHAFYAIQSSSQLDMIKDLDSVGFGWSRVEYDEEKKEVILNTSVKGVNGYNEYNIPSGFETSYNAAINNKVTTELMIAVEGVKIHDDVNNTDVLLSEYIINNEETKNKLIDDIVNQVVNTEKDGKKIVFDGVVIDFEGLKGDKNKQALNTF